MSQIIIAEDEHELRSVLVEALSHFRIRVLEARDGIEAFQLLRENPTVSLLLSDVRMPGMDGYALAERALELNPDLKVLMMTAYPSEHPPAAVLRAREVRTLSKPFKLDRMCELVTDMLMRP